MFVPLFTVIQVNRSVMCIHTESCRVPKELRNENKLLKTDLAWISKAKRAGVESSDVIQYYIKGDPK